MVEECFLMIRLPKTDNIKMEMTNLAPRLTLELGQDISGIEMKE
jgi:hypothetical protein